MKYEKLVYMLGALKIGSPVKINLGAGTAMISKLANFSRLGRQLAAPFTAWLRVPLSWLYSATVARFPDEEQRTISRTFYPPHDAHTRRQFCGYCGTQLTVWTDRNAGDEDYISITMGSLFDEDLEQLEELGLLQVEDNTGGEPAPQETRVSQATRPQGVAHRGAPWFESMIEDSALGRLKRQKGGHTSVDGLMQVEWEVVEFTGGLDGEDASSSGKRKLGELEEQDDTQMRT
jgi:hypothetical protein